MPGTGGSPVGPVVSRALSGLEPIEYPAGPEEVSGPVSPTAPASQVSRSPRAQPIRGPNASRPIADAESGRRMRPPVAGHMCHGRAESTAPGLRPSSGGATRRRTGAHSSWRHCDAHSVHRQVCSISRGQAPAASSYHRRMSPDQVEEDHSPHCLCPFRTTRHRCRGPWRIRCGRRLA